MNKVKYCRKCGNTISDSVKFCRHCGALQNNQSKSTSISNSQPSKKNTKGQDVIDNNIKQKQKEKYFSDNETKTAKNKRGIFGIIAALLLIIFIAVNIINFLSDKPNEPGSIFTITERDKNASISEYIITDVKITDDDLNIPAQSGFVSPEESEISIENTIINFSAYNLDGTKEVKVKKLNQISDSEKGFTIQAYDFEIEGISEFNVPVYIEMPYYPVIEDNLYEENTIFVQYYNENENKWEMIPSWINAEANTVAILTNHFSPFGIFQDDNLEDAKKVAHLFQYLGKYKGPTTPVYTTGAIIERYYQFVDEKLFQTYIDYKTVPVNDFASSFLNVMNHGSSSGEYFFYAASPEIYKTGIDNFSKAGKLFVFSKIAYQWYNGAATEDIILDNIFDLSEIAIASAGTLFAAPELTVIAGGVWLTGLTYDLTSTAYEYMSENEPKYLAYRLLSENGSIYYLPNEETCVYWKEIEDPSYSRYDRDLANSKNKSIKLYGEYGWAQAFNTIQKKYKENPIEMTKALERLLESYLDVFWYHYDIGELTDLLKSIDTGIIFQSKLYDDWEWPTEPEIQQYKANYRQKMKEYLRPIMKAMAQKALLELNELTLKEVVKLWDVVNMEIDFQIVDENLKEGEFFPASPLSDMTIKLSKLSDKAIADEWICSERRERSNSVFSFNIYAYIKAGCPTNVEFYEKNKETGIHELVISKEFTLSNPTIISIDKRMEDINGIYTGKAIGGNYITGEELDLIYKAIRIQSNKDGILIGPCLENGDYDPDYMVQCVLNKETNQYEGKVKRESGNQWMELSFIAEIYEVYEKPRAKVGYTQTISTRIGSIYIYEYEVERTSALKGSPAGRTSGTVEAPAQEPTGGGQPVGGFTGPIIPEGD